MELWFGIYLPEFPSLNYLRSSRFVFWNPTCTIIHNKPYIRVLLSSTFIFADAGTAVATLLLHTFHFIVTAYSYSTSSSHNF